MATGKLRLLRPRGRPVDRSGVRGRRGAKRHHRTVGGAEGQRRGRRQSVVHEALAGTKAAVGTAEIPGNGQTALVGHDLQVVARHAGIVDDHVIAEVAADADDLAGAERQLRIAERNPADRPALCAVHHPPPS
ncbi:MAG: hypothetical protein Q4F67_03650 [Propionibacteriaceae bacterium]|nr:hypothetical protein [Propionibacteriaceae bacterium]